MAMRTGKQNAWQIFFYEKSWDGIDIDSYIANSNIHILEPETDVDEYIRNNMASEDWTVMKASNGYHYLEFY